MSAPVSPNFPRALASALGAALLVVTLAACGNSSAEPAPDEQSLVPAAEGNVTYPLTLTTELGEVRLSPR